MASEIVPVSWRTVTVPVEPSRYDSKSPAVSAVARLGPRIAIAYL